MPRRVELRVDQNDGGAFSREEFIEYYGGTDEWDAAIPAAENGSDVEAAADAAPDVERTLEDTPKGRHQIVRLRTTTSTPRGRALDASYKRERTPEAYRQRRERLTAVGMAEKAGGAAYTTEREDGSRYCEVAQSPGERRRRKKNCEADRRAMRKLQPTAHAVYCERERARKATAKRASA